jgi:hypothetical protein
MILLMLLLRIFLSQWLISAQDLNIYGHFNVYTSVLDETEVDIIYSNCLQGMGLVTCQPILADDDYTLSTELSAYKSISYGQFYCLQCCGKTLDYVDNWDLSCTMTTATSAAVNLYGYELRIARNKYSGDREVIRCPLRRSACTYSSTGETLKCDRTNDQTFLVGYHATITVKQYDLNFQYWNGVTKCEIVATESNFSNAVTGDPFFEKYTLYYEPLQYTQYDDFKIFIVTIAFFFLVYGLCYFCRKNRCLYCQQKLVFCFKMCYKCRFVCAKEPDPLLIKALEEKGVFLQGKEPESILSFKYLCNCFVDQLINLFCCGFYYVCYLCCFRNGQNPWHRVRRRQGEDETAGNDPFHIQNKAKSKMPSKQSKTAKTTFQQILVDSKPDAKTVQAEETKHLEEGIVPSTNKTNGTDTTTRRPSRSFLARLFGLKPNPNILVDYSTEDIQRVVRHPQHLEEAPQILQRFRSNRNYKKYIGSKKRTSVYPLYDRNAIVHQSIHNENDNSSDDEA